jgi:hypothetical protein
VSTEPIGGPTGWTTWGVIFKAFSVILSVSRGGASGSDVVFLGGQ